MASSFIFEGKANLKNIPEEANRAIAEIEKSVRAATSRSRNSPTNPQELDRYGAALAKQVRLLQDLARQYGQSSAAARKFFRDAEAAVRGQIDERFPQRYREGRPTGRPAYDRASQAFRVGMGMQEEHNLNEEATKERRKYLDQLRIQRRAMQLSIEEERARLEAEGQITAAQGKIAALITEEARVQADINAMSKIRAAQVKRETQMILRSSDVGYSKFVQISGEGESLERQTAARIGLAAEKEMAKNAQEMADISGQRRALEQRRLAAERFATQLLLSDDKQYIRDSGEARELERQTAIRQGLAGEKLAAQNLTEIAQLTGERKALERRRVAAETLAAQQARPDLRDATLRDEASTNVLREREGITRRSYEQEGRTNDIGRRFALAREAQLKTVNDLADSAATQSAIADALRQNRALVEREVVERKRAVALRQAYEAEALAGSGGDEIRELNAREKIAKARSVALAEAEYQRQLAAMSDIDRQADLDLLASNIAAQEVRTRQERLVKIRASLGDTIRLDELGDNVATLEAQIALAKTRQKEAIERQTQLLFAQANVPLPGSTRAVPYGPQPPGNYTPFQRLYANLHGRQMAGYGGLGGPPTLGQFLGSRALSTAGFALGGSLAFGAMAGVGEMIREAEELELQLNILEAQFSAVGANNRFDEVRDSILNVSRATGIAADDMAKLTVQFAGVFRTPDAGPDTRVIEQATRVAGELAKIGNIPVTDIYDDLIAGARAFAAEDTPQKLFEMEEAISNIVVQARNVTGVDIKETLDFIGRSGAIGQAAGLNLQQVNAIGATLLQGSSIGGAALAEQFNRIITDFSSFSVELLKLIEDYPKLKEALGEEGIANVASGDASALIDLAAAYGQLDAQTRQTIIQDVGGRREGQTLAALFENATTLQEVLNEATGEGNTRQEEFQKRMETLSETVDQLIVRFQKMGLALFEAGLADTLISAAEAAQVLVEAVTSILSVFVDLNDVTGGVLGNILMMAGALKISSALGLTGLFAGVGSRALGAGGGLLAGLRGIPGALGTMGSLYGGARLAGSGRIGAAFGVGRAAFAGSTLAGFAPAAAAVLTTKAVGDYFNFREGVGEQGNELRTKVAERFASITSRQALDDLLKQVEDLPESGLLAKVGTTLAGSKFAEDIPKDEVQQQIYEKFGKKQAEALLESSNAELERLAEASGLRDQGYGGDAADMREWLRMYIEEPTNDGNFGFLTQLTGAASDGGGFSGTETAARIRAIEQNFFERAKNADELAKVTEELGDGKELLETEELLRGYEVGTVTFEDVKAGLESRIAKYKRAIELAKANGNMDAVLVLSEEMAKEQSTLLDVVRTNLDRSQAIENLIAELQGTTGSEFDATQALERLTTLSDAGAPIDELTSEAAAVVAAYKQVALDRIADAETEAEKLALLDQGFSIPEEARQAIAKVITSGDQARSLFANVARAVGVHADEVRIAVEQAIINFDNAALDAIRAMLQATLEWQKRLREMNSRSQPQNPRQADLANSQNEAINRRIADTEQQISDLDALAGATVPKQGTFSESDRESALGQSQAQKTDPTALVKAQRDLQLALSGDDPVLAAQIAIANARSDYQFAETTADRISALAAEARGKIQLEEAMGALSDAWGDFFTAFSGDDPIVAATVAQATAQRQYDQARNEIDRLNAAAAKVRADRALANALFDLTSAQMDLVIAFAEQAGDTVKVAETQTQLLRDRLAQASELGLTQTEQAQLEADIVRSETAERDARLNEQRSLIDFQLQIGEITKGQAIAAYQSLLAIPNLADEQRRELILAIEQMRGELGQDYQFNLPANLALPTIYEARRLNQQGGSVAGGNLSAYQDNRVTTVNVSVTEPGATAEEIGTAVAQAVGEPSRNGTIARRF